MLLCLLSTILNKRGRQCCLLGTAPIIINHFIDPYSSSHTSYLGDSFIIASYLFLSLM